MKKLLTGLVFTLSLFFVDAAKAQSYDFCVNRNGDRYTTGVFYEYGHGFPVRIENIFIAPMFISYMSFQGVTTMYSYTEDREIMMVNGEYVEIRGLWFERDCNMQLLVFSPRLGLVGSVPADAVAVPD